MKRISSDEHNNKYSVAWFKLAEFVSRGEKERALALYKLLMHAIDDRAFALQLEGDLLLAFDDARATDAYEQAAWEYIKTNRYQQAIAIYEHITALVPENPAFKCALCSLYQQLGIDKKRTEHIKSLVPLLGQLSPETVEKLFEKYEVATQLRQEIFAEQERYF